MNTHTHRHTHTHTPLHEHIYIITIVIIFVIVLIINSEGKRGGKSNRDSRTDRIQTLMNGQIDRLRKREKERGRQINHGLMHTE